MGFILSRVLPTTILLSLKFYRESFFIGIAFFMDTLVFFMKKKYFNIMFLEFLEVFLTATATTTLFKTAAKKHRNAHGWLLILMGYLKQNIREKNY